ncbi:hypothetical protein HDE_07776 [Halotydeus destructor]|nr:hypothetical protein HDE_07776 [Halotydeus destructor]
MSDNKLSTCHTRDRSTMKLVILFSIVITAISAQVVVESPLVSATCPSLDDEQHIRDNVQLAMVSPSAKEKFLAFLDFPPYLMEDDTVSRVYLQSLTIKATQLDDMQVTNMEFVRNRKTQQIKMVKSTTMVSGIAFTATGKLISESLSRDYDVIAILDTLEITTGTSVSCGEFSLDKLSVVVGNVTFVGESLDGAAKHVLGKSLRKFVKRYTKLYMDTEVSDWTLAAGININ